MTPPKVILPEPEIELDHVYKISHVANKATHWTHILDLMVPLLREVYIFDNLVVYLPTEPDNKNFEVAYARIVGRGRSAGADISWGDVVANQVYRERKMLIQTPPKELQPEDRLDLPHFLGIPLEIEDRVLGSLILIRFGGPQFETPNIRIAVYLAEMVSNLIERNHLQEGYEQIEAERRQTQLQENFISTISHELLTPLGFIKGYTTTLLRSDTSWDGNTQREFLSIIEQEADRLQELIDNLLDSSRLQSGSLRMEFQPVRLDALVKDVILRTQSHHENLEIQLNIETTPPPIQGDPRRIAQVLDNLIGNAIKYAPGSPIEIAIQPGENSIDLSCTDHGPGIPPQYLPYLFNRFYRNPEQSSSVRGTGLGLYICKQLIEGHDGIIWVDSEVGQGTTIHIQLPYQRKNQPALVRGE